MAKYDLYNYPFSFILFDSPSNAKMSVVCWVRASTQPCFNTACVKQIYSGSRLHSQQFLHFAFGAKGHG